MRNTRDFWARGLVFCGERKPDQNSCETENHRIHDLSAKTTGFTSALESCCRPHPIAKRTSIRWCAERTPVGTPWPAHAGVNERVELWSKPGGSQKDAGHRLTWL